MSGIAVAVAGSAVLGAVVSSRNASKASQAAGQASDAQVQASREAIQAQLEMYYQSRKDLAPWREVGAEALKTVRSRLEKVPTEKEFAKSPSYNFLLNEGLKARARSASATGRIDSGAAIKEATRYGQGLASTEYSNYITNWLNTKINPFLSLAGSGQVSAGQSASGALQTGTNIGQNYLAAGNARASGYINQANAFTGGATGVANALNQGINNYLFYDYMRRMPTTV